jgi:tetratricopeptide (TPR) repeat protein
MEQPEVCRDGERRRGAASPWPETVRSLLGNTSPDGRARSAHRKGVLPPRLTLALVACRPWGTDMNDPRPCGFGSSRSLASSPVPPGERAHFDARAKELLSLTPAELSDRLDLEAPLTSRRFIAFLLSASEQQLRVDPTRSLALAELGCSIAEKMAEHPGPRSRSGQAQVRALCLAAEACRRLRDETGAERHLALAACRIVAPTDAPERAWLCQVEALLRWDQNRIDEAIALFDRAAAIYSEVGAPSDCADCLAGLGYLHWEQEKPDRAIVPLLLALSIEDGERRPSRNIRLVLALGCCYAVTGNVPQARRILAEAVPGIAGVEDAAEHRACLLLAGQLFARVESLAEAEVFLDRARLASLAAGAPYDAGVASYELGLVYRRTGRAGKIDGLGRELAGAFPAVSPTALRIAFRVLAEAAAALNPSHLAAWAGQIVRRLPRWAAVAP